VCSSGLLRRHRLHQESKTLRTTFHCRRRHPRIEHILDRLVGVYLSLSRDQNFSCGYRSQRTGGLYLPAGLQPPSALCGMVSPNRPVRFCLTMVTAPVPERSKAHWVLSCPGCYTVFEYGEIPSRSPTVPFDPLWPRKPDFPDGGANVTCPACQKTSTFQRFELMYRPA
jgi:hypothetical protein